MAWAGVFGKLLPLPSLTPPKAKVPLTALDNPPVMAARPPDARWAPRVSHRKKVGKRDPRYLVKCGCCDKKLEIYYGGQALEINGVLASIEDWRQILLPLLEPDEHP